MNHLLALLIIFTGSFAQGQEKLTCTLSESVNPKNAIVVEADLKNLAADGLYSSDGLNVKVENYSFDLSITKQADGSILVDVIFYENNHVQDEVVSYGWELKEKGLSVVNEPLIDDSDATVMNFVCDYN